MAANPADFTIIPEVDSTAALFAKTAIDCTDFRKAIQLPTGTIFTGYLVMLLQGTYIDIRLDSPAVGRSLTTIIGDGVVDLTDSPVDVIANLTKLVEIAYEHGDSLLGKFVIGLKKSAPDGCTTDSCAADSTNYVFNARLELNIKFNTKFRVDVTPLVEKMSDEGIERCSGQLGSLMTTRIDYSLRQAHHLTASPKNYMAIIGDIETLAVAMLFPN